MQTSTEESKEEKEHDEACLAQILVIERDREAQGTWHDNWKHSNWGAPWVKKVRRTAEDNRANDNTNFVKWENIGLLLLRVTKLFGQEQRHPK